MFSYPDLPHLNAILNAGSALLMLAGYVCIRRKQRKAHRAFMITALTTSILFLGSYLVYHAHAGSVRFPGQGWIRTFYFTILLTHTVLASLVVPLVVITLWRAVKEKFDRHKKIARWTLPVWLYVSITGVLVYLMLYRLHF
jgi:putative membrane protein